MRRLAPPIGDRVRRLCLMALLSAAKPAMDRRITHQQGDLANPHAVTCNGSDGLWVAIFTVMGPCGTQFGESTEDAVEYRRREEEQEVTAVGKEVTGSTREERAEEREV